MAPVIFYLTPGATFRRRVEWLAGDIPVGMEGYRVWLEISHANAPADSFDSNNPAGYIDISSEGVIDIWLPDEITTDFVNPKAYALWVEDTSGDIKLLLKGPIQAWQPGMATDTTVLIDHETIRLLTIGIQGPAGNDQSGIIDGGTFN